MKKGAIWGISALLLAVIAGAAWFLGPALMPATNIAEGMETSDKAPAQLALRDASGAETNLANIAGDQGTVLILVRSADWCPFCVAQLKDSAPLTQTLAERGYTLASLSYDAPEILKEFSEDQQIPFTMLSDEGSAFIDAVGLRDPQYEEGHLAHGVPYASVLVIAPDGTVKAKFVSEDYRQRPSNEEVLALVDNAA